MIEPRKGIAWFRRTLFLLIAFSVLPGSIFSQEEKGLESPHYGFAELGWLKVDPDRASSQDGWFVGGSFGLKNFQFFGEYGDPGRFETWNVGAGWHGLLGKKADLVGDVAWVDADIEDGYRLRAGVRWMVIRRLEINGFIGYSDLDLTDNTYGSLGAIWVFSKVAAAGASYEAGDEIDTARIFFRLNFGKN